MPNRDFRSSFATIWLRLVTLSVLALVFTEALVLAPGKAQGWSFYLTIPEVLFEVFVRLVAAALVGMALGTVCTALFLPILWFFPSAREQFIDTTTKFAVVLVVFLTTRYALQVLIAWSYTIAGHRGIYDKILLIGQFVIFAIALCLPRRRKALVTSLDGFLTPKMTRRTALATVAGAAAIAGTEYVLSKTLPGASAVLSPPKRNSNFLLITFDALNAEDMSLYGRDLPTTPNIDEFAKKATVFANYFSASTFTTPTVAAMLTGMYPSENMIFHLQGRLSRNDVRQSLPCVMRDAGYRTAGFFANPFAYYLSSSARTEFDDLPEPRFQKTGAQTLWAATTPLHQDCGFGNRLDEYVDLSNFWRDLARIPPNLFMRFRPGETFEKAQQIIASLPEGSFFWVHVVTPHHPYLPGSSEKGRFLPESQLRTYEEIDGQRWKPYYPPNQQEFVDQRRLRYDEFVATADRAFGEFIRVLESSGKLNNTTVIVSADHGESFEGGVYQHSTPYLTRPVIHIPLIIRTPNQQEGRTVRVIADQTSLAPTILEMAGVAKPGTMKGPSLVRWLECDDKAKCEWIAFCQYFEKNSVFKPVHHGTVGVIDGEYQYVVYLDTQLGALRPLNEAQIWNLDRSAAYPERAKLLRETLTARFPDLVKPTA